MTPPLLWKVLIHIHAVGKVPGAFSPFHSSRRISVNSLYWYSKLFSSLPSLPFPSYFAYTVRVDSRVSISLGASSEAASTRFRPSAPILAVLGYRWAREGVGKAPVPKNTGKTPFRVLSVFATARIRPRGG